MTYSIVDTDSEKCILSLQALLPNMLTQQISSFPTSTQKLGCGGISKYPHADWDFSGWKSCNSLLTLEHRFGFQSKPFVMK